jgi:geranylgeranyl diphosphate synthase type II
MNHEEKIIDFKKLVNSYLERTVEKIDCPEFLKRAISHSLLSGGKRLRPIIVLSTREIFGGNEPDALPAACAIEMIHTYSLIHDDLPAMDNDTLRRGVPTCHVAFGEATAILAGDALLTEAFGIIAREYEKFPQLGCKIIENLSSSAGARGMVGGQVLDIMAERPEEFASKGGVIEFDIKKIHELKTGALLESCFVIGGLIGGADSSQLTHLRNCGSMTGLAFQIIDDYLDATSTDAQLGKNAGSDARKGKKTFVDFLGLEKSRTYAMDLEKKAYEELSSFGEKADLLKTVIRMAIERHY